MQICLGSLPASFERLTGPTGEPIYESPFLTVLDAGSDGFLFRYQDGTRFAVSSCGCRIWGDWPESFTLDDAATYLLGPVLGFVLRRRGLLCLHASAIRVGDHAVAFLGANGSGKSTLAAKFAEVGYSVLSDDLVPLRQVGRQFFAEPGYPRVRLWPDAALDIFGQHRELPALTPNWDKRYLDLDDRFHDRALPLTAIYHLGERSPDTGVPRFEDVSATEAYWVLASNTYSNYLLDRASRALEFDALSSLLDSVPLRTVVPVSGAGAVDKLCAFLAGQIVVRPSP
jgi:hypothetical protein